MIVDSIPDIIASCVVIGFGVNVLALSMLLFMSLVLNSLIPLHENHPVINKRQGVGNHCIFFMEGPYLNVHIVAIITGYQMFVSVNKFVYVLLLSVHTNLSCTSLLTNLYVQTAKIHTNT